MKTIIVALSVIGYTLAATQGQPLRISYCQGNVDGSTNCSACMNTGKEARVFADNKCANKISNTIEHCEWYNPNIGTTRTAADCMKCDGKDWLNIADGTSTPTITCSNDSIVTATCTTKVSNCDQSICHKSTSDVGTVVCGMCDSGYKASGTVFNQLYPSCAAVTITNCDVGSPLNPDHCYKCDSGYMVAGDSASCKAYTADSKCRLLDDTDSFCRQCDNGNIFNLLECESSAKLIAIGGAVMALIFFN